MGVRLPTTLKMFHVAGQKQQYNIVLQGNLPDPAQFDQLLLIKKRPQETFAG